MYQLLKMIIGPYKHTYQLAHFCGGHFLELLNLAIKGVPQGLARTSTMRNYANNYYRYGKQRELPHATCLVLIMHDVNFSVI